MPFVEWQSPPNVDPAQDVLFTGGFPLVFLSDEQYNARPTGACPTSAKPTDAPAWRLAQHFAYRARDGRYFAVPIHDGPVRCPGNSTDLASVPPFLWSILAPYGRQLRAALLHDHRCAVAEAAVPEDRRNLDAAGRPVATGRSPRDIREEADDLFREALVADDVGVARSWIFWTGVCLGRFWTYARIRAIALVLLVAVQTCVAVRAVALCLGGVLPRLDGCFTDVVFWGCVVLALLVLVGLQPRTWAVSSGAVLGSVVLLLSVAGTQPGRPECLRSLGWLAVAAVVLLVLILAVGWLTDVRVALIAMLLGPIVVPLVVVTLLVAVLLAVPDQVIRRLRGSPGRGQTYRPTGFR